MISSTFLTGVIVAFGFRVVIASPCRPSSHVTVSSNTVVSLATTSETLLVPTSTSETSTIDEISFSETTSSFVAESFSSISSLVVEASTDYTGLYSTADSSATETGTTIAITSEDSTTTATTATSDESTAIATTATSETATWSISDTITNAETGRTSTTTGDWSTMITTTLMSKTSTWSISETIATVETEATAGATTETTDEPTTASMSQTTTQETVSTTETTLPPVPTFELVARSPSLGDVVMHSDGRQVLISTYTFPSSWSSSITYDEETQHLKMNNADLCVMYEPAGRLAALAACGSGLTRQYRYLTCEPPSAAGLVCNQRAVMCNDAGCTDLGYTWNHFYLLGWDEGTWLLVIGADDLTTEMDAPLQGLEPVGVDIRASFS